MVISEHILQEIAVFGRYEYSPEQIAILLELNEEDEKEFFALFNNRKSSVYKAYLRGKLAIHMETIENLEKNVESGSEGAGDSARAILYLKNKHNYESLRKELFNV